MLSSLDLRPPGVPPSAILVVRSLPDPLPGRLSLARHGSAPPSEWRTALVKDLDAVARRAVRPALGAITAGAEAVLFADPAELLACLARDWLNGVAGTRWWWRALFRDAAPGFLVRSVWTEEARAAPEALERLAATREAVPFVLSLPPEAARGILDEVLRSHALVPLQVALDAPVSVADPVVDTARKGKWAPYADPAPPPEIVVRKIPEVLAAAMPSAQRTLLAVGLALVRLPGEARTSAFAHGVGRWLHGATNDPQLRPAVGPSAVPPSSARAAGSYRAPTPFAARAHAVPAHADWAQRRRASEAPRVTQYSGGVPAGSRPSDCPALTPPVGAVLEPAVHSGQEAITTAFGGVFCLINAGLFLKLYGDFTTPLEPGIELPLWDFLALAGESFSNGALRTDPLWGLLGDLAGRGPEVEPGSSFVPPCAWRIPQDWLVPFISHHGAMRWREQGGQLVVRHPAGFPILDVEREDSPPRKQLQSELRPYRGLLKCRIKPARALRTRPSPSPVARWCGWVMPYLGSRIALAMRRAGARRAAGDVLVRQAARVVLSAARVDIHLQLARLPIEVRLAGLDRDPGWVPSAGRGIRFHYD
ncbi:MAG TPA: hypothetical protein VI078_14975 [bacterium]